MEERVKPERTRVNDKGEYVLRKPLPQNWWIYGEKRPALYHTIGRGESFEKHPSDLKYPKEPMNRVIISTRTTKHIGFSFSRNKEMYDQGLVIFTTNKSYFFSVMHTAFYEMWARKQSSSLGTGGIYNNPSDCFETFPFPEILPANPALCDFSHPLVQKLETLGEEYHALRSAMMKEHTIGLTKLYNAFHNPKETRQDFKTLRELHKDIDQAVKVAYGWHDLDLAHNFYEVPYLPANDRVRYTIAEKARLEILRRLYKLNTERYEAEVKAGLWSKKTTKPKSKKEQGGLF